MNPPLLPITASEYPSSYISDAINDRPLNIYNLQKKIRQNINYHVTWTPKHNHNL